MKRGKWQTALSRRDARVHDQKGTGVFYLMSVGSTTRTPALSLRARPSRSGVDNGAQCARSLAALGAQTTAEAPTRM